MEDPQILNKSSAHSQKNVLIEQLSAEKVQELHPGSTLDLEAWEQIDDSLLSFELTAIAVCCGSIALIASSIHAYVADPLMPQLGSTYLDGFGASALWWFILSVPLIIGVFQIGLAIGFSFAAAFEQWEQVSIQDVVRNNLPRALDRYVDKLPLRCTARRVYLLFMYLWIIVQLVAMGVSLALIDAISAAANSGKDDASGSVLPVIQQTLAYSAVVFNYCCEANGWSKQGRIEACPAGSTTVANCTLPNAKLCACITNYDPLVEARQLAHLNASDLCSLMMRGTIGVKTSDDIPGTTLSIRNLIPLSIDSIPLVGPHNVTYGCGTGWYRGFEWEIARWVTAAIRPYVAAALIISGVQLITLILGSSVVCARHDVVKYNAEGEVEDVEPTARHQKLAHVRHRFGLRALFEKDARLSPYSKYVFTTPKLREGMFSPRPRIDSAAAMRRAARPSLAYRNKQQNGQQGSRVDDNPNAVVGFGGFSLSSTVPPSSPNI